MTQQPVSTPWQVPWPEGTIARYWTVAGATVDVTDKGVREYQRYATNCTGCPYEDEVSMEAIAHRDAQTHAERCRALPRPEVTP